MPSVAKATDGTAPNNPAKLLGRTMSPTIAKIETKTPPIKKRRMYSVNVFVPWRTSCGAIWIAREATDTAL
jgi:hypothetical protein